jgi:hypothetical protein
MAFTTPILKETQIVLNAVRLPTPNFTKIGQEIRKVLVEPHVSPKVKHDCHGYDLHEHSCLVENINNNPNISDFMKSGKTHLSMVLVH